MANLQYIGARYVPKFFLNPDDQSNDWKSGVQYEALMIVTYNNDSYTSKEVVPANIGDPASNPEYWACTTRYTAALQALQTTVGQNSTDIASLFDMYKNLAFCFETAADMKADEDLKKDDLVMTIGYLTNDDQGGAFYKITDTLPSGLYDTLANGLYAEMIVGEAVNVRALGARGNGIVDDTDEIQKAIDYAQTNYKKVYIPAGNYLVTRSLRISKRVEIYGEVNPPVGWQNQGGVSSIVFRSNDVEACIIISDLTDTTWNDDNTLTYPNQIKLSNLRLDGNNSTREACGIACQGYNITFENVNVERFYVGYFIKNSYLINMVGGYCKCNICVYHYHVAGSLVKMSGGWYASYYNIEQLPSNIWDLLPGTDTFENYNTCILLNSGRALTMDSVALEHTNYGIQMTYRACIDANKLNLEDVSKGGFKICDPDTTQASLSADFAILNLTNANLYNGTYETGFYWFIMNTTYYWEVHADLMQYIQRANNINVGNYSAQGGGVFEVTHGASYFNSPAWQPYGLFYNHNGLVTGGTINSACKFEGHDFIIDFELHNVTTDPAVTGNVVINIPCRKTFSNGVWTNDSNWNVYGYAFDHTNNKFYVAFIDSNRQLRIIDTEQSGSSRVVQYEELSDFYTIKLSGRFHNYGV